MAIVNIKQRYFLLLLWPHPSVLFRYFAGKKLACAYFQLVSRHCCGSLTSAFIVLEEEVKSSEMWKLTCQECKVNTIRAGKRKQKKKSNNEKRIDHTGVLLLPSKIWSYYLEMSSTRAVKTCQKCKNISLLVILALKNCSLIESTGNSRGKATGLTQWNT